MRADPTRAAELLAELEATEVFLRVLAAEHLPYASVLAVERRALRRSAELLATLHASPAPDGAEGTDELLRSAVDPAPRRAESNAAEDEPTWVTFGDPELDELDVEPPPDDADELDDGLDGDEDDVPLDITQPIPRRVTPAPTSRRAPPEPQPIDFSDVGPEALVTLDEPILELSGDDLLDDLSEPPVDARLRHDTPAPSSRLVYDENESEEAVTVIGHPQPVVDDEAYELEPEEPPALDAVDLEPVSLDADAFEELSSEDLSLEAFDDEEVTHVRATPAPAVSPSQAPRRPSVAAVRVGLPKQAPTPMPAFRAGEGPRTEARGDRSPRVHTSVQPDGTGIALGLEEEDEPIAVGAVEDYEEDWDAASVDDDTGSGFRVAVQEYVDDDEVDEDSEEPEALPEPPPPPPPPPPTRDELRAIFEAARAAAVAGDMQRGADLYSDVIDVEPDNVEAHVGRGRLYLDLGDYTRAMSDFMVAEDLAPYSPEPQIAIGDLYFARKDYRKAIEYFDAALEMSPDHAMAFCRRGISHYYRKNYAGSLEDLERAQGLDPEIPNIATYITMARKKARR